MLKQVTNIVTYIRVIPNSNVPRKPVVKVTEP